MRRSVLIVVGLAACHHRDERPLREAIIGTWKIACSTSDAKQSRCFGDDDLAVFYTFHPGGLIDFGAPENLDHGSWTLDGDTLDVRLDAGQGAYEISLYRARIDDDQLVLWDTRRGYGKILARNGAHVDTEPLAVSSGGETTAAIDHVRYTVLLPRGYALTHDGDYQRWTPPHDGLYVELQVEPASDCRESVGTARKSVDGVDREYLAGIDRCVDRARHLTC